MDNEDPPPPPPTFHNLNELEALAAKRMPLASFDYYAGFAGDGATAAQNAACWRRLRLLPRILRDVSRCDASIANPCLGPAHPRRLSCPVIVAPMAMHGLADPVHAERATVRAAAAAGFGMAVSTMANVPLEELGAIDPRPPLLLFQLYVLRDRDLVASMVRRAEASGYDALVVTVDAPRLGRREADERNRFALPEGLELGNLRELAEKKREKKQQQQGAGGGGGGGSADGAGADEAEAVLRAAPPPPAATASATQTQSTTTTTMAEQSGLFALFASEIDDALDWSFLAWLRTVTRLPVWVKGVLHPADAVLAAKHGASAVVVSNHGGRQLDGAPTALDALPAVVEALGGTGVAVVADGGVRRGADVVKALALGAHAVMVGRPVLYALAAGGEAAVLRALRLLKEEVELALALCGVASPAEARAAGRGLVLSGEYGEVPASLARADDVGKEGVVL